MINKMHIIVVMFLFLILAILGGCGDTEIQSRVPVDKYPEKPINFIIPFNAGGGLDLTARALEKASLKYLGQPLVITNKPGGAGALGWNEVAAANPDGYTLGITSVDLLLLAQYGAAKYNYLTALSPVAQISATPLVLAVQADKPWTTLKDLIAYAKDHPGEIKFGHSGLGSFTHVTGEMFGLTAGIQLEQVPFSGGSESVAALLGGHTQVGFSSPTAVKEHVKTGKLRVLAVTGTTRINDPLFAQVPCFPEQGLDITLTTWYGIAIPKETPAKVRNKLAESVKAMLADPEVMKNLAVIGGEVEYLGPEESQAKWLAESQKIAQIIQTTGVLEKIKAQKK